MHDRRLKHLLLGLLSALAVDAGTPALAFYEPAVFGKSDEPSFSHEAPIEAEALESLRGGFVTSSGMVIDFAFSANTLVDGQLIRQSVLNSLDLPDANSLRSIIQVGEGNVAFDDATNIDNLPNVLTIVQNNLDNLTIQQLNVLDLSVKNVNSFVRQSVGPEIDFQNSLGLAP